MTPPKKRETIVTVWLLLMLTGNIAVILLYMFLADIPALSFLLSKYPMWIVYVFSGFATVNIASVCFLFRWKKWAFYVLCGSAVATLSVNLYIGVGVQAFFGLGEVIITYLVLNQQWSQFYNY